MNINRWITGSILVFGWVCSRVVMADDRKIDDYFAMSPAQLAEMPVTIASGTPRPVFQSAAVTSVVTADQIKSMGATELHEVLETIPGVHAKLQPNSFDYSYSIRGISNAANSEVLILMDGTRITTPFGGTLMNTTELPLEAIARVEVIRGPGSALYGADAFAGVINIITKKANDINGTALGVRAGDHGIQSGWGQQSVQWAGWDIATSLQYQRTDGDSGRIVTADAQTGLDQVFKTHASLAPGAMNTNYETYNGHLKLQRKHWDLGFWAFDSTGGARAGIAGALDPNGNSSGQQYLGDVRFSTEDWLDDWELTAHASYLNANLLAQASLYPANAVLPIGLNGNISYYGVPTLFTNGVKANLGRMDQIPSLELGSIYKGFSQHILRFSSAFRYEGESVSQSSNFGYGTQSGVGGALNNVTGTAYSYLPNTHRTIGSVVAQDEWQLASNWQLTTGLRYDHYSDFGGTINPRVGLVWDINKQLTSKLMYGKAFRAPSFSEQFTQNNPVVAGNSQLKPETINTFEWAMNYRPMSTVSTAVNLYYYQINNLIAQVPNVTSAASASIYKNSGNQNGYGSEFEFNWQWNPKWDLKGNYAWVHAVNEINQSLVTGIPAHHVYAALVWKFLPQWQLQPQLNYIGGRTGNASQQLSDYETIDFTFRGAKLFGHLNLAASLRNALDTKYYEPTVLQMPAMLPMPGRSFYLEASVNF